MDMELEVNREQQCERWARNREAVVADTSGSNDEIRS